MSQQRLNGWWSWGPLILQKKIRSARSSKFLLFYKVLCDYQGGGKPAKGFICLEKGKERQRFASLSFVSQRSRDEKTQVSHGGQKLRRGRDKSWGQKRDWKKKNGMLCPRLQKWSFTFRKYRFTKSPAESPIPSYFTHGLRILAWDPDLVSSRQELNDLQGLDSGWWILASS